MIQWFHDICALIICDIFSVSFDMYAHIYVNVHLYVWDIVVHNVSRLLKTYLTQRTPCGLNFLPPRQMGQKLTDPRRSQLPRSVPALAQKRRRGRGSSRWVRTGVVKKPCSFCFFKMPSLKLCKQPTNIKNNWKWMGLEDDPLFTFRDQLGLFFQQTS